MKRQAGFTLIELVMVIVILGILSAFALPRFADLGQEARLASLNAALGAVRSASAIARADALVNNQTGPTGTVTLEGQTVQMVHGYPQATAAGIGTAAQIGADYTLAHAGGVTTVTLGACSFTYTQAANATTAAVVSAITEPATGC